MNAGSNTTHSEILGSEGSIIDENYMNRNHDDRAQKGSGHKKQNHGIRMINSSLASEESNLTSQGAY